MRSLKKFMAVVVAVTMLLTAMIPAFAAESAYQYEAEAETLHDLGLMAGNGTSLDLGGDLTREQGVTLFLAMFGLTADAQALTDAQVEEALSNYTDAATMPVWAQKFVAYAVINKISIGTETNVWGHGVALEGRMFSKWILNKMGYTTAPYETAATEIGKLAGSGLTQEEAAGLNGLIKRDGAAGIIYGTLTTKANAATTTVIENLVAANKVDKAKAIASGLYKEVPAELAVASVKSLNLKQLAVTFNKEIDEAGDESNYSIETEGSADIDAASDFALQSDNKTVVITLTTAADQQEEVELTVEGIEDLNGNEIEDTTIENIEFLDTVLPVALSAEVVGNDTIKVTFNEPVKGVDESDFEVDGGDLYVAETNLSNNGTEVNVVLYSELEAGKVSIEVGTGIKDYADFGTLKKTFELTVVEDNDAPVVVGYKDAKPSEVTLIFNEDIEILDADEANFYHTNSKNTVDADIEAVDVDGKELTLHFTENELPEGTAYVYIAAESLSDLWDNENDKIQTEVEVTVDSTKPTLDAISDGENEDQIVLEFSEALDSETAQDVDNYMLLDKDGDELESMINSATLSDNGENVTLLFDEELDGNYSIVIENVEDEAGNEIAKVTKSFKVEDVTAPVASEDFSAKIYNAGAKDQMVKVNFGEAMATEGKYSVLDLEKYAISTASRTYNLDDIEDVEIKAVNGSTAVEIEIPDADNDGVDFAADDDIVIARVADAAGNYTALLSQTMNIDNEGTVLVDTAELTSNNTVIVTFKDKLTTFNKADFEIHANGVKLAVEKVNKIDNEDGNTEATFILDEDLTTTAATGLSFEVVAANSKNVYGEPVVVGDRIAAIDDEAAPVVVEDDEDAGVYGIVFNEATGKIEITFSENLDATKFSANGKNGFSVTGGGELAKAEVSGNKVILTSVVDKEFTANTNVVYNAAAGLSDGADNEIASFTHTDKLN